MSIYRDNLNRSAASGFGGDWDLDAAGQGTSGITVTANSESANGSAGLLSLTTTVHSGDSTWGMLNLNLDDLGFDGTYLDNLEFYARVRRPSGADAMALFISYDGPSGAQASLVSGPSSSSLGGELTFPEVTDDVWYFMKWRMDRAQDHAYWKFWEDGDPEPVWTPSSWLISTDVVDPDARISRIQMSSIAFNPSAPTAFDIAIEIDFIEVSGLKSAVTIDFSADSASGDVPLSVQFTDLTTPPPSFWLWDFGDGKTSTLQNPTHTYTQAGLFDVTLRVGFDGNPIIYDKFARDETNGLGDADSGETWAVVGGTGTIPTQVEVDVDAASHRAVVNVKAAGPAAAYFEVPIAATETGSSLEAFAEFELLTGMPTFGLIVGGTGVTGSLTSVNSVYFEVNFGGTGTLAIYTAGPDLGSANANDGQTYALNTPYRVRFRAEPTFLRAKIWEASDEEPIDWGVVMSGLDLTLLPLEELGWYAKDTQGGHPGASLAVSDIELTQPDLLTKVEYIRARITPFTNYLRDRLLLSVRASYTDENLYNHTLVVASGNKAQIYYGEVKDIDPDSPTNIDAIGDRVLKIETDLITTQTTANKAAKKAFLDNALISEDIAVDAICMPAFEGNDVIGIKEPTFAKIERNFRLQSFNIPLTTSRQSLKVKRVIDLQTETISVNDDILFIGATQAIKSTAGTSVSIALPDGVLSGDFLLVWIGLDGDPGATTPVISGFTSITGSNKWKRKFAGGSEPVSYSVSWTGSRRGVVTMFAYRNVDPTNPVAKLVSLSGTDDKTVTVPGMTLASGEYHLVAGVQANRGDATYTWPSSWTEREEGGTGGTTSAHVSLSTADRPYVGSNPPAFNVTASVATSEIRYQVALRKDIS